MAEATVERVAGVYVVSIPMSLGFVPLKCINGQNCRVNKLESEIFELKRSLLRETTRANKRERFCAELLESERELNREIKKLKGA